MAVSAGSVHNYREQLRDALQPESSTGDIDTATIQSVTEEIDEATFESEVVPVLDDFIEEVLTGTAATTGVDRDVDGKFDLVIKDEIGEIDTIFEFKRPSTALDHHRKQATQYLSETPAQTVVLTNGGEFRVFSQINDHVEQILAFTITDDPEELVRSFESLLIPDTNRTGIDSSATTLRSTYTDVITSQLKYFVRVLKFTATLESPPEEALDTTHAVLLEEAGFDAATFRQSTETVAGIIRNNTDKLSAAGEHQLNHPETEEELVGQYGISETSDTADLLQEGSLCFIEQGLFEQLIPTSSDFEPPLDVLTEPEFYSDLASLLDDLAYEYEALLEQRLPVADGGLNDLSNVVALVIGVIALILAVLGFSVPTNITGILMACLFGFKKESFRNLQKNLSYL